MDESAINIIIFFLFFAIIFITIMNLSERRRKIEKNLSEFVINVPKEKVVIEKEDTWIYKLYKEKYNKKFIQAKLKITYNEFKKIALGILIGGLSIFLLFAIILSIKTALAFAVFVFIMTLILPELYIMNKKQKRVLALNSQKTDILTIMSSASATNASLEKTFESLSQKLDNPAKDIFEEARQMIAANISYDEVLEYLKIVFDSDDFNLLLSSYNLWRQYDSKLSTTMNIVQRAIRDKEEIDLKAGAMVANAKVYFIITIAVSVFFIGLSLVTIRDIFLNFISGVYGQIGVMASLIILFGGLYAITKVKNSIRY